MQSVVRLADGGRFAIDAVTCTDDHTRWSAAQVEPGCELVLVRRGRFRRRALGIEQDVDSTLAYLSPAGQEEHFAHPAGGDVCTLVTLGAEVWELFGEPGRSSVYVDGRVDLAHRRVLASARVGDVDFGVAEELLGLVAAAVRQVPEHAPGGARELVAAAREAMAEMPTAAVVAEATGGAGGAGGANRGAGGANRGAGGAGGGAGGAGGGAGGAGGGAGGLWGLAAVLGVSPYRLSRAFSAELGVSVTRYRNRVRVGVVMDRLAGGERDLAGLAADLGFADQAHLCRTVRQHLGYTPTAVRRLLGPAPSR